MTITKKEITTYAAKHNLYARYNGDWCEWVINSKPRNPDADYFCADNDDAMNQLQFLAGEK